MIAAAVGGPLPSAQIGLIHGEPEERYRTSGAWGSTELRAYLQSPEGFRLRYMDKHPLAQFSGSPATAFGTLVHLLMQGEEHYRARCVVPPPECFTASGAKSKSKDAAWMFDQILASGRLAISPDEDAKARFIADRIRANPLARKLLDGSSAEVTGRIRDPHTGLLVQVRFDVMHPDWSCDFKTQAAPLRSFRWSVRDHLLHVQAALYDAVRVAVTGRRVPFHWIVVSTIWPFECRVVECPEPLLDAGMAEVDRALTGIAAKDWGEAQAQPDIMDLSP